MKKIESINNAKFQQLTKEQASEIKGGSKVVTWGGCKFVWLHDSRGDFSVSSCEEITTTYFLGIAISHSSTWVTGNTQTDGPIG